MTRTRFVREYHRRAAAAGPVDIELEEALRRIGWTSPDDLEAVATRMLSEGCDGPAITASAAGLTDRYGLDRMLDKAVREMGHEPSSVSEAGLRVAKHVAGRVVSGELSPDDGVSLFVSLYLDLGSPSWLSVMYVLEDDLSEAVYRPDLDADSLRQQIVTEAQVLLDRRGGTDE